LLLTEFVLAPIERVDYCRREGPPQHLFDVRNLIGAVIGVSIVFIGWALLRPVKVSETETPSQTTESE
jgi:hypothetical protein